MKTLKGSKDAAAHPLRHLERGALAALGAMLAGEGGVPIPESEDALLQRVSLDAAPSLPWYASLPARSLTPLWTNIS